MNFDVIEKIILMIASGLISGFVVYFFVIKTEEYKFKIYQRKQAEKIAELLAKWIKYNGKENEILNEEQKKEHFEELNRLTWELAMWISDDKIVRRLMERLSNKEGAPDVKKLIFEIRELMLNKKSQSLKWEELVHFTSKK